MTEITERQVEAFEFSSVNVFKHANADKLEIYQHHAYPVVIRKGEFRNGQKCLYVPVDMAVDTSQPEFSFLKHGRIRAQKLRGTFSQGLIVPYRDGLEETVKPYVSPSDLALERVQGGRKQVLAARLARNQPKMPVYGVTSLKKAPGVFLPDEMLVVTEKIHGCNARYCYSKGRLWVGSHKVMRGASEHRFLTYVKGLWSRFRNLFSRKRKVHQIYSDVWWEIAKKYDLENKLKSLPDVVLYGEIYGDRIQGKKFSYGLDPGEIAFKAFDLYDMKTGKFYDWEDFTVATLLIQISTVPVLSIGLNASGSHYDMAKSLADKGHSQFGPGQLGEGIVIKPVVERQDDRIGRVIMKYVGQKYLLESE